MSENSISQKLKNLVHKYQAKLAIRKYNNPQKDMVIIGVTGTDGKTTTTSMIAHVLKKCGFKVGYISTVQAEFGDKKIDTGFHVTTPDPWDVPKYLHMMKKEGIKFVVLESTSSGLQQNRLHGINFDSGIITNIRNDHLDYHVTWENYARAKFRLIQMIKDKGLAILNKDDEQSANWISKMSSSIKHDIYVKWVSMGDLKNPRQSIDGIEFNYLDTDFNVPIIGEHNFLNTIQVINLCLRYTEIEKIQEALKSYSPPEGRMQVMKREPFSVIIDFAHTPAALESALDSIVKIQKNKGKIITVFGCAGKRDKGRRLMGEVSARLSDVTVLTAEDPRNEKLFKVNNEIISHAAQSKGKLIYRFSNNEDYSQVKFEALSKSIDESIVLGDKPFIAFDEDSINSRRDAIDFAIKIAKKDDIVFITGKGHERSLAFGDKEIEYDWSDQQVVREILG